MPVRKVPDPEGKGRTCYRWGSSGAIYCGRTKSEIAEARRKAEAQGAAIRYAGYKKRKR